MKVRIDNGNLIEVNSIYIEDPNEHCIVQVGSESIAVETRGRIVSTICTLSHRETLVFTGKVASSKKRR